METVGFVGVGKIGLTISQNLIKNGYRVVGYRRGSLAEFEKIGGVPARSAADVGAPADIVFSFLPSDEGLQQGGEGPEGLCGTGRPEWSQRARVSSFSPAMRRRARSLNALSPDLPIHVPTSGRSARRAGSS